MIRVREGYRSNEIISRLSQRNTNDSNDFSRISIKNLVKSVTSDRTTTYKLKKRRIEIK